jgi:hypothetical protein
MMFDCLVDRLVDRLVDLDVHCWCSGLRDRGGRLDSSWTKSKQDQSIFLTSCLSSAQLSASLILLMVRHGV